MHGHCARVTFGIGVILPFVVELALRKEILLPGEDAQLLDAFVTPVANDFPALLIGVLVFLDVLGQGVQGPVGRRVGEVEEKRFVVFGVFVHVADGLLREVVGNVISLGNLAHGLLAIDEAERVEVVHHAVDRAVEILEAAAGGVVDLVGELLVVDMVGQPFALVGAQGRFGDVPFPDHARVVSRTAERLGDRHGVLRQRAAVSRQVVVESHPADARLVLVEAREQRRPGGAAAARVVEVVEAKPVRCQPVEVGGMDFTPVTSDVGEAQIVGQNDDYVRPGVFLRLGRAMFALGGRCGQKRNWKN